MCVLSPVANEEEEEEEDDDDCRWRNDCCSGAMVMDSRSLEAEVIDFRFLHDRLTKK